MPAYTILAFGQTAEALETDKLVLPINTPTVNVTELRQLLEEQYPLLRQMAYQMAVNQQISPPDDALPDDATIALLPPFSGG